MERLQDPQKPMPPRDSLAIQSAALVQRQDSGYGGRAVVPRRPSLERDQRPIVPPGLSTSQGAYSNLSGQPPTLPVYTPVRPHRDSLSPPAPPSAQQSHRESVSLAPVVWDPNSAVTQASGRRDSVILAPQPRPSLHHNSLAVVQSPAPVPVGISPPPVASRRPSESSPRGQGTLVSKRVRINDGNLICPSPIPMHERRKGWHNRRGDQLWRNNGEYKPALPGEEYPPDLANYPDYGEGWMNEECVRINMQHRLVPKAPLRSALKRPRKVSNAGANPTNIATLTRRVRPI